MRKLPRVPWTILEWGHYQQDTASWNQILALTKDGASRLIFGNSYSRYDPSEMSQGKIGYFGICYKGAGEPPVTPRLIQYDQPTGATILTTEAQYQTYQKIFWWQVTGANVDYTSGSGGEPNGLRILIPSDAEHSDTTFIGGWLIGWKSSEREIITV